MYNFPGLFLEASKFRPPRSTCVFCSYSSGHSLLSAASLLLPLIRRSLRAILSCCLSIYLSGPDSVYRYLVIFGGACFRFLDSFPSPCLVLRTLKSQSLSWYQYQQARHLEHPTTSPIYLTNPTPISQIRLCTSHNHQKAPSFPSVSSLCNDITAVDSKTEAPLTFLLCNSTQSNAHHQAQHRLKLSGTSLTKHNLKTPITKINLDGILIFNNKTHSFRLQLRYEHKSFPYQKPLSSTKTIASRAKPLSQWLQGTSISTLVRVYLFSLEIEEMLRFL